ncbi:MAG: HAD-IIA family hydrolase [Anaerolineae bacterium]
MTYPTISEATSGPAQVAAVILAAGASTRFGRSKQLLDWHGKPLLAHVADVALDAGLDPVIAVLGCWADETYAALGDRPVQRLINWRWEAGLSTSVHTGLAAVPLQAEAALFLQGDQPLVGAGLLRAIVARFQESGAAIVHPTHAGQRGTPVLFARRLYPALSTVSGDEGGRSLIARHPDDVATVEVDDGRVLTDIDTWEDFRRIEESNRPRSRAARLADIHHLIIDMDGVLWRGDEPMPGLAAFFAFLRQNDIAFTLATNNSSRTPEQYTAKLARFGVQMGVETVLTSALVCAAYLGEVAPSGSQVYVVGEEGVQRALEGQGFTLGEEGAETVVVGWDRNLTWQKLVTASLLIHDGAAFVGTNPDTSYPTERGPLPGNGALLAALQTATGIEPVVTGKPEPWMYREALRRMGATPETSAMIGDRLDTDIAGGSRAGLTTVLTLSGIATEADVRASSIKPDLVCEDIRDLMARWKEALA